MENNTLIEFHSNCLGDSIAWMPYVEEYRKIHNLNKNNFFCSSVFSKLFDYPNINFISKQEIQNYTFNKVYKMGFWLRNLDFKEMGLKDPRTLNLQEVACDILKIPYKELKPNILINDPSDKHGKKYVCIAVQSTAQAKYWNYPNGWNIIVDYLIDRGYDVICVDKHKSVGNLVYMNHMPQSAIDKTGDIDIKNRIAYILNCEFFIGLPSGLSWLAWALNKKVILISGFSDPKTEFFTPHRLINKDVCNSCWNDINFIFSDRDFLWCPRHKNTPKIFECTKSITPEMVINKINSIII
jgi:autotransporter strand-loop-strand O-heptosyltransferase